MRKFYASVLISGFQPFENRPYIVWTMEKEIEHVTSRSSETSSSEVQELSDEGSKKKNVENEEIDDRVYDSIRF